MKISQSLWPVRMLIARQADINLNPIWQRGPAWNSSRQVLLIDSILRGMDIPKVYLRRLPAGANYKYEAVDGQQRLRAIWLFAEGELPLNYPKPLGPIDKTAIAGRTLSQLSKKLRERFARFKVGVGEIKSGHINEVTLLFSRLQMGAPLNPAELRNAVLGPMRHTVDAIAMSHVFFRNGRLPDRRYKRQDYAAHLFALAAYNGAKDLKAPTLEMMFQEFGPPFANKILRFTRQVTAALDVLAVVNALSGFRITQKWIFVDLCWLVMQLQDAGRKVDAKKLAVSYQVFEGLRRQHTRAPERLLRAKRSNRLSRHLYDYIVAFKTEGGSKGNIGIRHKALRVHCSNIEAD